MFYKYTILSRSRFRLCFFARSRPLVWIDFISAFGRADSTELKNSILSVKKNGRRTLWPSGARELFFVSRCVFRKLCVCTFFFIHVLVHPHINKFMRFPFESEWMYEQIVWDVWGAQMEPLFSIVLFRFIAERCPRTITRHTWPTSTNWPGL